ncbi:MAG: ABC transporter permease [Candidatus Atribacteria bacterium]|nr:ABC transporter permease [Candidatus Atribacteria bacterium]
MGILSLSLFQAMLRMSMPVLFAALGGMFCERAGVVNIGLEGIMLNSAFFAVLATFLSGSPWIGFLSGVLSGVGLGVVIAILTVKYSGNQIVVGTGINVFGLGFSAFMCQKIWGSRGASGSVAGLPLLRVPYLEQVLGENTILIYVAFALIILSHLFLFHTPWGLRLRAVGENPQAADTAGVNVHRYKMVFVTLGSGITGLGGVFLSLAHLSFFAWGMTSGRGFMGLAAMIFGKWTPLGCFLASLLFGFTDALQMRVQALGILPSQIILLFPYVVTILVLSGFVGKALPPSDYKPYEKR